MRVAEPLRERRHAVGFFQGRQVFPLQVFNEGDLQRLRLVGILFDTRNLQQARRLRGTETPLPGDDQVMIHCRHVADQEGLKNPFVAHGFGQAGQVPLILPGLVGVRPQPVDGNHPADRRARPRRQFFHIVRAMTHAKRQRQSTSPGHVP